MIRGWTKQAICDQCGSELDPRIPFMVWVYTPHFDNPKFSCHSCVGKLREPNTEEQPVATAFEERFNGI